MDFAILRSHFWYRLTVSKMGFCLWDRQAEAQSFGFNETLWLMASARVGLCCGFCDFAVSFLVPPDGPKNGTVKVLFFCSFTKLCMRSQKWDRQAVPFLGPCLGSFFEVFCIRVAEAQSFGFNETLWLMATGRATREALLSEAGFEKVFRTQNWVRRSKLFCRWFCFLLGQAGCISVAA